MNDVWLKQLIRQGESQHLDFKVRAPTSEIVARTVAAFLNTVGGTIVIGVAENRKVVGVHSAKRKAEELRRTVSQLISPKAAVSVEVMEVDGKSLVVVDVPAGKDKPYMSRNRIYARHDATNKEATADEISQWIAKRYTEGTRWERTPALGVELKDIDTSEVLATAQQARELFQFSDPKNPARILQELGLESQGILCNSAVILFGKTPARRFPQIRIRAICFQDSKGSQIADNRIFEGHAFSNVEHIISFLQRNVPVSSQIPTATIRRQEKRAYPLLALREGVLNAVMHRDYATFDGGLSVSVFPDRIKIWNSGSLPAPLTLEDLKRPHPSRPPNPDIAHVFLLRGYIERIGIGTWTIIRMCQEAGLPEPDWQAEAGGIALTLRLRTEYSELVLNRRQRDLLTSLRPDDRITYQNYLTRVSPQVKARQARFDLASLVRRGFLRKEGRGRATEYVRTNRAIG